MLEIINNIFFWMIAFFVALIFIIIQFVMLILLKMKTHAMIELKAFFKKCPVSMFFDDGKFMDMKAIPVENGIINDKEYGAFVRHSKNTYLGRRTRNVYDVYDKDFAYGVNVNAAHAAKEITSIINFSDPKDVDELRKLVRAGKINDESIDIIRSNLTLGNLKEFYTVLLPHNQQAAIEKKAAKRAQSMKMGEAMPVIYIVLAIIGALVGGYILLSLFA